VTEVRNTGENKAWELLESLDPEAVCRAASATYDFTEKTYTIRSFGMDFHVSVNEKTILSAAEGGAVLLGKLGDFFRISLLWYLVSVRDIACTGRLVKLDQIRGGDIFTKGSHRLPLDIIIGKYGKNKEGFLAQGKHLGGEQVMQVGDASIQLFPLPGVPVVLSLWMEDDEFPARADIFFDSTCDLRIPADIIWSVAMTTILMMS
jgi:Domain of unknown function (DUF3786)